jgi:hypothetical protein
MQPSFAAYLDRKDHQFVLSRQFSDGKGLNWDSGPLVRFSREEMEMEGLRFAEDHLDAFGQQLFKEPSEFTEFGEAKRSAFNKAHKMVVIYLAKPSQLVFWPFRLGKRGKRIGYVALTVENSVSIEWPTMSETFMSGLMTAFYNAE